MGEIRRCEACGSWVVVEKKLPKPTKEKTVTIMKETPCQS